MPAGLLLDLSFGTLAGPFRCAPGPPLKLSRTQDGREESNTLPLLPVSATQVPRKRAPRANAEQTGRTLRTLEMSQCGRFSLTEGEQVPLPQSTNDPIISIRSHDWCYTPLLSLSSFPHVQVPPHPPRATWNGVFVPPQAQ